MAVLLACLIFEKQKNERALKALFGNIHSERVFVAGDKIAHLLDVNSAIFRQPLYPLCVHDSKAAPQSAFSCVATRQINQ
jgi:hypothetical protein